jgi:hypothetical protein
VRHTRKELIALPPMLLVSSNIQLGQKTIPQFAMSHPTRTGSSYHKSIIGCRCAPSTKGTYCLSSSPCCIEIPAWTRKMEHLEFLCSAPESNGALHKKLFCEQTTNVGVYHTPAGLVPLRYLRLILKFRFGQCKRPVPRYNSVPPSIRTRSS